MKKAVPAVSLDWNEGRFFDLWMLVHMLSGVAGGFVNVFFGLTPWQVVALGSVMMIAWEFGESAIGVKETLANRVIDVVVGLVGVGIALVIAARISEAAERVAFVASIGIALIGLALGARNFRRRKKAAKGTK